MSDDRLRARLGDAARRDVQERWTHVHMARRLLPVYQEAIARHRAAPPEDRGPAAQAVVDLIERAGAPPELVTRLRQSATFESGAAGREVLLNAAMGRLPSALYGPAVEACLQAGDADRALRLVEDARTFAADLSDHASAELRELESLARRLAAPGDRSRDAGQPADRHAPPPPAPGSVALSVDDAVALLRDGRVALGMARLLSLADGDGAVPAQRLTASYHLASALKRCGFVGEAEGRFRSLIAAPGFDRLAADVRAAAWFHAGDLSRAAGRPDEAEARFQRCLALNPSHGRAAALLSELRQSGGPAAAGRGRETR
jgi:tetratricopeptide (TPR) repeat protein